MCAEFLSFLCTCEWRHTVYNLFVGRHKRWQQAFSIWSDKESSLYYVEQKTEKQKWSVAPLGFPTIVYGNRKSFKRIYIYSVYELDTTHSPYWTTFAQYSGKDSNWAYATSIELISIFQFIFQYWYSADRMKNKFCLACINLFHCIICRKPVKLKWTARLRD